MVPPHLVNPGHQALPGYRRHIGQPFLISLYQNPEGSIVCDNVTEVQPHGLRASQAAANNDTQHRRIAHPDAGYIGLAGTKQGPDLFRRQGPSARQTAAAQGTHRLDVLEALHVHHVMAPQAAPAAGIEGRGTEYAGDNTKERGHGLPAAGRLISGTSGPETVRRAA